MLASAPIRTGHSAHRNQFAILWPLGHVLNEGFTVMLRRRSIVPTLLAVALVVLSASLAYGANPHYKTLRAQLGSPKLIVSGTEVGLGSGETVVYVASADVTTTAKCVNGGGKNPSAANKTFSGELESTATSQADRSGKISTELVIYALPAAFCPSGQTTVVTGATFSNVTLTDTTNGVVGNIPGTFVYVAP